jgi:hypothetical protein
LPFREAAIRHGTCTPPKPPFETLLTLLPQPAKRRAPSPVEASAPKQRQSKLAKEYNITNAEETEIKEAFELFAEKKQGEKAKVLPIGDVRRAMMYFSPIYLFVPNQLSFLRPTIPSRVVRNADGVDEVH